MGYGGHDEVADDSEHEREVGEGAATAAAREPQGQHRRGRLECGASQHPDPEGGLLGGISVRRLVATQKGGLWRTNSNAGEIN